MARELSIEVVMQSADAEATLARLETSFLRAGDTADEASKKVERFERSYKDGKARQQAKSELDSLTGATSKAGDAAATAATKISAKDKALTSLTSAVMRFAAPVAIGAAIKSTLDWAGNLSDLSKSTGISTTALQKFEIIGKASGASMQDIANTAIKLSDNLAGGNKSAATAIAKVGLNMGQLVSSSPDQALLEIAKAASAIHNPMERVAFLTDAVGKAGAKTLLPMVDDLAAKWNTTAGVINDKGIQALDDLGDSFGEVGTIGKQFLAETLIPLAPGFTSLTRSVLDFVSATIPKLQAWFSGVLEGFMRADVALATFSDNMRNAGLRELDAMDPARAAAHRAQAGLPPGGFYNNAQTSKDALDAFVFSGTEGAGGNLGQGMFGPAFVQPGGGSGAALGGSRAGRAGAKVLPFRQSTFALGSTAASIFAMANTPGSFNAGSLPFMSSLPFLQSGAGPLSFANGSTLAGTVPMNAPGKSGGFLSGINKGGLALMAGGLAAQFLPGRVGQVAQGAMGMAGQGAGLGAMFGPQGAAIGAGIGALVGGISSLFGSGKAKKNAANAEISQVFEQFKTKDFQELPKEAERLGVSMDKALNAKTMKDFGAAVDEVTTKLGEMHDIEAQIADLTARTTVDFDKMNAVVQEFGLDISKLGPAFQQAKVDKEAQRIIDAVAIMEKGGADMNGVLEGMADEISKVVQDSIKFGTTVPENMKPWIESLIKSGKLVDENGKAITDMSNIKFGAAMESDMSKLTKKLDELIAKLGQMANAFTKTRKEAENLADIDYGGGGPNNTQPSGNRESSGFATGGVAGRDFRRPGYGDVFPALLKRGERVLPAGASGGGMSLSIGSISIAGGSRADTVEQIGEAVVSYIERRGGKLVA